MIDASLKDLAAALAGKKISSTELATLFLERIGARNPQLNAFITVDREKSLAMARAADARIARGEAGPLTGIPLAHKDIFCAEGWLTTCGSKMLSNFVSPYDATVIARFKAADPQARRAELLAHMDAEAHAYLAADRAYIDDVIHPAETRDVIRSALARAREGEQRPGFKHRVDP